MLSAAKHLPVKISFLAAPFYPPRQTLTLYFTDSNAPARRLRCLLTGVSVPQFYGIIKPLPGIVNGAWRVKPLPNIGPRTPAAAAVCAFS
jgi:hypothetical protein